jgi:hypothetical protein
MTKAQKQRRDKITRLGCIVCLLNGNPGTPAQIHHIRRHGGKRGYAPEIPLCPEHHQYGGPGVAIHAGRKSFERVQGVDEWRLLEMTEKLIGGEK